MSTNNKSLLRFLSLIPAMQIMLVVGVLLQCILEPSLLKIIFLLSTIYILPPLMWRIFSPLIPAQMGSSYLGNDTETVNGWFVSFQIQRLYNALPILEIPLKLIPGVYSSWLRLWGARIGENVNWKIKSRVIDRPFVHVGDRSLIGNETYLSAHSIKKENNRYLLLLKEIIIGSDVVLTKNRDAF